MFHAPQAEASFVRMGITRALRVPSAEHRLASPQASLQTPESGGDICLSWTARSLRRRSARVSCGSTGLSEPGCSGIGLASRISLSQYLCPRTRRVFPWHPGHNGRTNFNPIPRWTNRHGLNPVSGESRFRVGVRGAAGSRERGPCSKACATGRLSSRWMGGCAPT